MSKEFTEFYLSIGLTQADGTPAYAGNHDEIVASFICGSSMEGRGGWLEGQAAHKEHIVPVLGEYTSEYFTFFRTDYGDLYYELDPSDSNRLRMKFDYMNEAEIVDYLNKLWPLVDGVFLATDYAKRSLPDFKGILISDFRIIERTITSKTTHFIPEKG